MRLVQARLGQSCFVTFIAANAVPDSSRLLCEHKIFVIVSIHCIFRLPIAILSPVTMTECSVSGKRKSEMRRGEEVKPLVESGIPCLESHIIWTHSLV